MHLLDTVPAVLVFAGHDPCGGAGLVADIEALRAQDCHALPIATAQTVQNTQQVIEFVTSDTELIRRQFAALLKDVPIAACKIGMLGSADIANVVADCLEDIPDVPVVLDPVIKADQGGKLAEPDLLKCIKTRLLPMTTLITPNIAELQALTETGMGIETAVKSLLNMGSKAVLLTGTHSDTPNVINRLFVNGETISSNWPRLPNEYHGSGCTLASAIAGQLAYKKSIEKAVEEGLRFTWQSLDTANKIGKGQWIPRRG